MTDFEFPEDFTVYSLDPNFKVDPEMFDKYVYLSECPESPHTLELYEHLKKHKMGHHLYVMRGLSVFDLGCLGRVRTSKLQELFKVSKIRAEAVTLRASYLHKRDHLEDTRKNFPCGKDLEDESFLMYTAVVEMIALNHGAVNDTEELHKHMAYYHLFLVN